MNTDKLNIIRTVTAEGKETFQGTIKDFVESGLKVNGKFIDQVGLSVMGKYGMMPAVGERKPARGKPAAVYQIQAGEGSMFSFGG